MWDAIVDYLTWLLKWGAIATVVVVAIFCHDANEDDDLAKNPEIKERKRLSYEYLNRTVGGNRLK
jgi:hypothetical protein